MIVNFNHNNIIYSANLKEPIDISIPIHSKGAIAWNSLPAKIEPVKDGDWIAVLASRTT